MMHETPIRMHWPRFVAIIVALDVAAIAVGAGVGLLWRALGA